MTFLQPADPLARSTPITTTIAPVAGHPSAIPRAAAPERRGQLIAFPPGNARASALDTRAGPANRARE
jgi:hypothetical protein